MEVSEEEITAAAEACLLGCAVGDSIGLPYEGLKPARISRRSEDLLEQSFFLRKGMVSDDTDHSVFVAQALSLHPGEMDAFAKALAKRLRFWFLCLPAGIGLATLKSILKLWVGVSPERSGVFSAGNGAAMRSAIIGVRFCREPHLRRQFVSASTGVTHRDPKADYGARAVAALAAQQVGANARPSLDELKAILEAEGEGQEWQQLVNGIIETCESGDVNYGLNDEQKKRGISGYIYETLPVAVTAWWIHYGDFRKTIETVVRLGGDTDTVAAIAGALAGVSVGKEGIPESWCERFIDFPHRPEYLSRVVVDWFSEPPSKASRFSWWMLPRGPIFMLLVIGHGLRRLLPPY